LLIAAISASLAAQTPTKSTIRVANTDLSWTMPKQAVLDALKKNENNLVVRARPKDESEWWVIDQQAKQASACLHFDEQGKLLRIDRSWTPTSSNADDFVKALYNLVSQHKTFGDCVVGTSHDSEPHGESDEVFVGCQKGGIRITHMQAEAEKGKISTVSLYEIIERPE
jgi:hypothetical protein